jgi:hypothetical protein
MHVPSQITPAEMREAIRLNLTPANIWKFGQGSLRLVGALIALIVVFFVSFVHAITQSPVNLGALSVYLAVGAFIVLLIVFKFHRTSGRYARAINKASMTFAIDGQGLTRMHPSGVRTAIPWSAINRWREGALVFTIGGTSNYNVISKAALGQMQAGELRSILFAQVRGDVPGQAIGSLPTR